MFPFPHSGRVRLYVDADQDPKQATEVVARLVELGVPVTPSSSLVQPL